MVTIFYNKSSLNDTMTINLSPKTPIKVVNKDHGVMLYSSDDELVGINVFNVSKLLSIEEGYLFLTKKVLDFIQKEFGVDLRKYHSPKFVVAEIIDLEKIPDSHLTKCTLNIGHQNPIQVVCGGKNLSKRIKVVLALPMVIMPNGKVIIPSKLLGVESNGMICSRKELFLKESNDDTPGNILILDSNNYKVGSEFVEHYSNYKK